MQKKYGLAPLGEAIGPVKSAIFGGNNARLYNIDVKRTQYELKHDRFAQLKTEYDKDGAAPSHMRYGYVDPSVASFPHEVFA
jgi:hypothetical protein